MPDPLVHLIPKYDNLPTGTSDFLVVIDETSGEVIGCVWSDAKGSSWAWQYDWQGVEGLFVAGTTYATLRAAVVGLHEYYEQQDAEGGATPGTVEAFKAAVKEMTANGAWHADGPYAVTNDKGYLVFLEDGEVSFSPDGFTVTRIEDTGTVAEMLHEIGWRLLCWESKAGGYDDSDRGACVQAVLGRPLAAPVGAD